jgi:hypothetical protein
MNSSDYQQKIISIRTIRDKVQVIAEDRILDVLKKSYADLTRLMDLANVESLTYANYASRRAAIAKIIMNMTRGINTMDMLAIRSTAQNTVLSYQDIAQTYAESKGYTFNFPETFSTIPQIALRNTIGRLWLDGANFSDRIWTLNKYASDSIDQIITSGIARGESAVNMSRDLQEFLIEPSLTPGTTWTTAIKPSISGRGTIHYNALRLARTEINNSYRESLILANQANPITLGVKWNVSASHVDYDICDVWATIDQYGMGAGVYPAGMTPIDHPNGKCYLTEVLRPSYDWDEPKPVFDKQNLSQDEILSALGAGATEGQKNATLSAYNSINELLDKNAGLYRKAA